MASSVRLVDGSYSFEGGVNSNVPTSVQSASNPNGLKRNQLAWLDNATVRGGGILQRSGWQPLVKVSDGSAIFQGGYMYDPGTANPYLIISIGGHILKVLVEAPYTVTDLSVAFGLFNPATTTLAHFAQAEQFLVIQAGDYGLVPVPTLPLFWDGTTLRRSKGITNNAIPPGTPGVNEIPAAGPMIYYQLRLWYAQGRVVSAGDIVFGPSGTAAYNFTDAVLNVTENPLVVGGDGFAVPSQAGNIRALNYAANLNTNLGQSQLFAFTRKQVYSLDVPITRTAWIAADNNSQPQWNVIQTFNGAVGDRCLVQVNGDIFYQSPDPAIRSLISALRYYQQWGNRAISSNENRALQFNDRSLMAFATGIEFDNRVLMGILPVQSPVGVVHQAIAPLDFDTISSFEQNLPPAWEGVLEPGLILQMYTGDFGGLQRGFGLMYSKVDGGIHVWEISIADKRDNGDNRVNWQIEFPAYTFGKEFELKELDGGEIWIDKIAGRVEYLVEWRPDADPCWKTWVRGEYCAARSTAEDVTNPITYPVGQYCEGYKFPIALPKPNNWECSQMMKRPSNRGYQFQVRLTLKGWSRIRAILLYALPVDRAAYDTLTC